MATLDEAKAAAQDLVDALNTLEIPTAPATITEVDVKQSDGSQEMFVPEAPAEPAA